MYGKILQRLLQNFFLTMGRAPITPNEWSRLRKQAMELARKEGGDPITGAGIGTPPKSLMDTTKDLPGISSLQNNPKIIPFPKQKSRNMTPLKRAMNDKGIRGLMMQGNLRLGEAPKTLKSTLDQKKAAYEGHVNKEMWIKDKIQQNKQAIERFKQKFGKNEPKTVEDFTKKGDWDPYGMAEGGIAPLVGEPSYAADFYDDRIPYAGGSIVKGGRWFLKNLKKSLNDIETNPRFKNLSPEKKEVLTAEIKNLIKSVEGGGPIPEEMIQTIRSDPKFFEVSKTRSTDPDLYDFEQVVLDYGKDRQAAQIVDEVFGKGHPENQQIDILEQFDVKDRKPNFLGGRVSFSGGGKAGLPAITYGMPQAGMQGPQMPAGPQPAGIPGAQLQIDQNLLMQQQMMQNPWMQNNMQQGIGGTPQYKGQLRMPFAGGGMGRRAFLKFMASLGALPFIGRGAKEVVKEAPTAIKAAETITTTGANTGMPSWFPAFVQKVLKEGKDLTPTHAPKERVIVAETKLPHSDTPVYVEHDLVTGDTMVDIGMGKHGWSDGYHGQPTRLHLKKGEIIEEGKMKGQQTPDEFVVEEAEFTGGHPENVKFEESSFNNYGEHGSDFSELEEFATGKVTKESKAQKHVREADWDDVIDPSDPPDDYASGGIARMLGE